MHDYLARELIRQREEQLRRTAEGSPGGRDREPFRSRTARRLHRIARTIDVTDL